MTSASGRWRPWRTESHFIKRPTGAGRSFDGKTDLCGKTAGPPAGGRRACCTSCGPWWASPPWQDLRLLNRYDVEGLDEAAFHRAVGTVFSEPQVDDATAALPAGDCVAFGVEPLPGQFDQRADSAAQCIQLMTQGERPTVRTAKVYLLFGALTAADVEAVKRYVINPVECREASLDLPETPGGWRPPSRRTWRPSPASPPWTEAGLAALLDAAGPCHGPGGPEVSPGLLPGRRSTGTPP